MKTAFYVLVLVVVPGVALATEQVPDRLHFDGLDLFLSTGWGHPSPLETYYYQGNLAYPFQGFSTANYRGHVAAWEIVEGRLYLTDVQVEHYEPNAVAPKVFDYIVKSYEPNQCGVKAKSGPPSENGDVFADWFSGILECYRIEDGSYCSYFFHVEDGNVIDTQIIDREDYEILYNAPSADALTEELKRKYGILVLNENYITYYFRLSENDTIDYQGQECRLETGWDRLSPIFGLYDNNHLQWPYNWENSRKSGAPHCQWRITDDRLYLTKLELYSGLRFDTIDTEALDLATLFGDKLVGGVVAADWVSGVYLIQHGRMAGYPGLPGYTYYQVTELTYIRVREGTITESYTVPSDFDPENMPKDVEPGLKQIIEDYRLPSALDNGDRFL